MGGINNGSGSFCVTGGYTTASGNRSTAMGDSTTASGGSSTTLGRNSEAIGENSTAIGLETIASGNGSTAMGTITTASGWNSTAIGARTTAQDYGTTAIGLFNEIKENPNPTEFSLLNAAFVIGNGGFDNDGKLFRRRCRSIACHLKFYLTAQPPLQVISLLLLL